MSVQVLTARQAADRITDGATVGFSGFIGGSNFAEEIALKIEERFLETGYPTNLSITFGVAQGDETHTKGINHLARPGLIRRVLGAHFGLAAKLGFMIAENEVEAYTYPLGIMNNIFRDAASKKPFTISHVGLGTFIDPRLEGGKLNGISKEDLVHVVEYDGQEYLRYEHEKLDFVLLSGSFADKHGNISLSEACMQGEVLILALACRNNGGKVFVQVKEQVQESLPPHSVAIPGILVDAIVVAEDENNHMHTYRTQYNPAFHQKCDDMVDEVSYMQLSPKKIIARRAAMELRDNTVINLGLGVPEFVAQVAKEEGIANQFTMCLETGVIGGIPQSGMDFGVSINPDAIIPQPAMFDYYQGGGLDQCYLSFAETDAYGNVNVSKFGCKVTSCGGFIDISQNSKAIYFCGTFMARGLEAKFGDGRLQISKEGLICKFREQVGQITFSASLACKNQIPVLYITERAVFRLTENGILLQEYAPGIDLERDILAHMPFPVALAEDLMEMDRRIFTDGLMGLASQ